MTDVTCVACGCLCDDVVVDGDRVERACAHGSQWFLTVADDRPAARIGDRECDLERAIARAAELLTAARSPLVVGLAALSCEAQRAALALADHLGATVDRAGPADPTAAMFPGLGEVGCTLGEARDRADLLVYFDVDLAADHWRHEELIRGPARRRGARVLQLQGDFARLWTLRAMVRGRMPSNEIVDLLRSSTYTVIFHRATGATEVALRALAIELNGERRCRTIDLGSPLNAAGEKQVTTWTTGYSRSVGFHAGFPRHFAGEFSAQRMLARGEVDVVLNAGPALDVQIPQVLLSTDRHRPTATLAVALFAATPGIDAPGTVFRSDGIALPLRPAFSTSFPDPLTVLQRLTEVVRSKAIA